MSATIKRYQKVTDRHTTHRLRSEDGSGVKELCTLDDGYTYVSVPEDVELPEQSENIEIEDVELTSELLDTIKATSKIYRQINTSVEAKIRSRYSIGDELKARRMDPSDYTTAFDEYAAACVTEGDEQKAALGLVISE